LAVRHADFLAVIETTLRRLQLLEPTLAATELGLMRRRFQEMLLEFLEGSENFRHTLVKPFGYAGDFRLLEMLARNTCASGGLAYHFDQSQLEYPASVACRQRIAWICEELVSRLRAVPAAHASPTTAPARTAVAGPLTILDLGIGAGPVEQQLLQCCPEVPLCIHAVDWETAALEYLPQVLTGPRVVLQPWRLNLREPSALARIGELAAQAEVVVALGLLEALNDQETVRLLRAVLRALPPGGVLYAENFVPTHPSRSVMEWFLDFHLAYRSLEELRALALQAGAEVARMESRLDSTGSLALVKLTQ
jgi:hypothetical protein